MVQQLHPHSEEGTDVPSAAIEPGPFRVRNSVILVPECEDEESAIVILAGNGSGVTKTT